MPETLERQSISLVHVVDADTQDFLVDSRMYGTRKERCRTLEIDAWEMRGPEKPRGILAREDARRWLNGTTAPLVGEFWEKDSFGRWLMRCMRPVPGGIGEESLAKYLLDNGHGVHVPFELHVAIIRAVKVVHGLVPRSMVPHVQDFPKKHGMSAENVWPNVVKAQLIDREASRYGVSFDSLTEILKGRDYVVEDN